MTDAEAEQLLRQLVIDSAVAEAVGRMIDRAKIEAREQRVLDHFYSKLHRINGSTDGTEKL